MLDLVQEHDFSKFTSFSIKDLWIRECLYNQKKNCYYFMFNNLKQKVSANCTKVIYVYPLIVYLIGNLQFSLKEVK